MKKYITIFASLLLVTASMVSCQSEENEISENEEQALSKSAPLTKLLKRVAMVETNSDNTIDSTDCFKVQLPVTVIVNKNPIENAIQVEIQGQDDIEYVRNILLYNSPDIANRSVDFIFPITVIFPDYTTKVINNEQEYYQYAHQCDDTVPVDDQPVNCIAVNYPVTIFGYDSSFQIAETYTITNDAQLFLFIFNLQATQYYAIDYPISLTYAGGQNININSNLELQQAINSGITTCNPPIDPCPNPKILTDSLVVYIPFANELKNLTYRGTPTITGNYHYVTDRNGNPNGAFSFDDGANNGLNSIDIQLTTTTNNDNDILKHNNFTFSVWVKRQDNSGANPNEQIISNLAFSLFMGITQDPSIKAPMLVMGNNIDAPVNDSSWIDQGLGSDTQNWHHLVVSYNGTLNVMRLYRNGVLTAAISPTGMPAMIPRLIFGNRYKGYMDDIRVYNKILTDAQVQQLYQLDGDIYTCLN